MVEAGKLFDSHRKQSVRDSLTRATMTGLPGTASLGDKRCDLTRVGIEEAARVECPRILPLGAVVGAVYVEQYPLTLVDWLSAKLEVLSGSCCQHGHEWVVATNLVSERLGQAGSVRTPLAQLSTPDWVLLDGDRGEGGQPSDRHGGAQDVEELDSGGTLGKAGAVFVDERGHSSEP
jgi:hypothetical protein